MLRVRPPAPGFGLAAILTATALAFAATAPARAHPHVFIDVDFGFRFTAAGLEAVQVTWRFDDVYSEALLPDYLKKGERQLSAQAVKKIEADIFRPFAAFRYNTDLTVNGVPMEPVPATGFAARVDGRILVFEFVIPLGKPVSAGMIELLGFDPEYFIEYSTGAKPAASGKPYRFACQQRRFRRDTEITGPIDVSGLSCTIG